MRIPAFNYSVNYSFRMESPLALELSSEVETTEFSKKTPFLGTLNYSVNYSFRDDMWTKLMEIPAFNYSVNYSLRMESPAILLMIVRMIIEKSPMKLLFV